MLVILMLFVINYYRKKRCNDDVTALFFLGLIKFDGLTSSVKDNHKRDDVSTSTKSLVVLIFNY